MVILIEGPDGTGKTTLARQLAQRYNCYYKHSGKIDDIEKYYADLIELIDECNKNRNHLIIDRGSISNKVYTKVFNDSPLLSETQKKEFESRLDLLVFCLPVDKKKYFDNFDELKRTRGEQYGYMAEVYKEFEKEFGLMRSVRTLRFDYQTDKLETVVVEIERIVNIQRKQWVCFFSQTGSEINEVSKKTKLSPSLIITNSLNSDNFNQELLRRFQDKIVYIPQKPNLGDYQRVISSYPEVFNNCFITLHGYLRIIPKELCSSYNIYNLHPGLITQYPELKGFNPQEKAYKLGLSSTGSVIHKVVEEVDSGEILCSKSLSIKGLSLNEVYRELHDLSTDLWVRFLKGESL